MDKALDRYIADMSSDEDALLRELERETNLMVVQPRMISGHIQGKLLELLVKMIDPRRVLEIGTFTGYSALCMAAGLGGDAILDTIEVDDELESIASGFFARSVNSSKIRHHIGSALEMASGLGETYDLVFMDGDKREYPDYYRMLIGDAPFARPLVRSGSFILADNILWYGKVVEPLKANDLYTKGILDFNRMVKEDPRAENVILPIRDGINIIRIL